MQNRDKQLMMKCLVMVNILASHCNYTVVCLCLDSTNFLLRMYRSDFSD